MSLPKVTLKRSLLTLCLILFLAFLIWYTRPLPISAFIPESSVNCIGLYVSQSGESLRFYDDLRQKGFLPDDPSFDQVKTEIESLRFRRNPIKDAVYQLQNMLNRGQWKTIHQGDFDGGFALYANSAEEEYDFIVTMRFWIDEWEIGIPTKDGIRFHKMSISGGQGTSQHFWTTCWDLLPAEKEPLPVN